MTSIANYEEHLQHASRGRAILDAEAQAQVATMGQLTEPYDIHRNLAFAVAQNITASTSKDPTPEGFLGVIHGLATFLGFLAGNHPAGEDIRTIIQDGLDVGHDQARHVAALAAATPGTAVQ